MENTDPPELDLYTIPSYSSWFQWNNIHEIERLSLREFFDGSSITRTPRIYKEYRDFIITKYRENPTRRMTFTDVRRSLVGDVSVLHKVFTFLEKWGLINFDNGKSNDNSTRSEATSLDEGEEEKWRVRVDEGPPYGVRVVAAPNSLKPVAAVPPPMEWAESGGSRLAGLASYSDAYGAESKTKEAECGSCKEGCGGSGHYEYNKEGSFILCEKCFKNGNYGDNRVVDDFKFIDSGNHEADWTEAETLLLLESVLKHGDDWELVARNVKTKSKRDCISKLIQLPFGDLMLGPANGSRLGDTNGDLNSVKQGGHFAAISSQGTLKVEDQDHKPYESQQNGDAEDEGPPRKRVCHTSISDASSSLLKQVAHVCNVVGPQITASVGEAAISALCYEYQCSRELFDDDDDDDGGCDESRPSSLNNNEQESALPARNSDGAENLGKLENQTTSSQKNVIPLTLRTRAATATTLGAAAAHAKILASQEEREMEHLVATIIETQLKKVQHKMKFLDDMEGIMEEEHAKMEEVEVSLVADRIDVLQRLFSAPLSRLTDHPMKNQPDTVTYN